MCYLLSSLSSLFLVSVSIILITWDSYSEALVRAFLCILKKFRKITHWEERILILLPCRVLGTMVGICIRTLILRATLSSVRIPILLIRGLSQRRFNVWEAAELDFQHNILWCQSLCSFYFLLSCLHECSRRHSFFQFLFYILCVIMTRTLCMKSTILTIF